MNENINYFTPAWQPSTRMSSQMQLPFERKTKRNRVMKGRPSRVNINNIISTHESFDIGDSICTLRLLEVDENVAPLFISRRQSQLDIKNIGSPS